MNWLPSSCQINRLAEPVRLASTAGDHAKFPFAPNTPPPRTTPSFARLPRCQYRNTTVQNQPKLTKIDHPDRAISSARRCFRRNTPEKFFRSYHPTVNLPRPAFDRSPGPDHRRTGPNKTEQRRTPERTIFSAHRHFRRKTPKNSVPPNTRPRGSPDPQPTVRRTPNAVERDRTRSNTTERPNARSSALSATSAARRRKIPSPRTPDREAPPTPDRPFARHRSPSNRIGQDRTAPNARTHDLQRSAPLPPQHARKSLRPERSNRRRQPTASCPREA